MTTPQIVKWVTGFTAGVATLIWLYSTFLTKEAHRIYVDTHKDWSTQVLGELKGDIVDMKEDLKDIKGILSQRKVASMWTNKAPINIP